jgi:hypothetical protein
MLEFSPDEETIIDEKMPSKTFNFDQVKVHAVHLPYESKTTALNKLRKSDL